MKNLQTMSTKELKEVQGGTGDNPQTGIMGPDGCIPPLFPFPFPMGPKPKDFTN